MSKTKVDLSSTKIKAKYKTNKLGLFAAKEFKRLCDPFTPQRDKLLVRNVRYKPWETIYLQPYARPVYDGGRNGNAVFRKDKAPYASKEWDKAAIKAGRGKILATSIQKQIYKGEF